MDLSGFLSDLAFFYIRIYLTWFGIYHEYIWFGIYQNIFSLVWYQRRIQGGQNLWISGGFQAPTGAEPPWKERKKLSPPGHIPEYAPVWYTSEYIWFGTQLILRKEVRESSLKGPKT